MNGLHLTAFASVFLVLVGFNHAYGFMTVPKKPTEHTPTFHVSAKSCVTHSDCMQIPQTSCVPDPQNSAKKVCLCGDYQLPNNAACHAAFKGPEHICTTDDECVDGASCAAVNNAGTVLSSVKDNLKTCKCLDGFFAHGADCNGGNHVGVNAVLTLLFVALSRTLY